jgi:hypothetical protein
MLLATSAYDCVIHLKSPKEDYTLEPNGTSRTGALPLTTPVGRDNKTVAAGMGGREQEAKGDTW